MDNKASKPPVKAAKGGLRKSTLDLADAELIRSSLLSKVTGEKTDYRLRVIYAAAMDGRVSNASLRHLIFRQMASDWASGKCHVYTQQYFARLEGLGLRTIVTAEGQLEAAGYLSVERRQRETSHVSIVCPGAVSTLIRSIFDTQLSAYQEPVVEDRVQGIAHQEPFDTQEIAHVDVQNFAHTKEKREKEDEEEDRGVCASENGSNFESFKSLGRTTITGQQFEEWNRIGNAWGGGTGKQAARSDTDPILSGLVDAFAAEPTDTVRLALADVLGNLAAMLLGPQTGVGFPATRKYAANHMRTAIAEARKALAEQEATARVAAELAEIKIAKERAIADQGVAAHASAVATGAKIREARTAAQKEDWRDRKASARKTAFSVLAERKAARQSAPDRFDDALPKVVEVHGVWITGRDANRIIDAVEGCTKRLVEDALFEAGGAGQTELGAPSKRNELLGVSEATGKPTAIGIIEWATKRAKRLMLFAKFGKPQDLCGGPAAHGHTIRGFNGSHKVMMESEYLCVSQQFMDRMKEQYPNAWVEHVSFKDESGNNSSAAAGDKSVYYIFSDFVKKMPIDTYGVSSQNDAESAMQKGISALHDAMTRGLRLKAEESERLKAEFPDSFLIRKTLPGRAALAAS